MLHHQNALKGVSIPLPRRLPKDTREAVEAAIAQHQQAVEGLIGILDLFDGESDFEPSLGDHPYGRPLALTDCESDVADEPHDEEPDQENSWHETHGKGGGGGNCSSEDMEPSLAHTLDVDQVRAQYNLTHCERGWGNSVSDLEDEHDGREPQCEDEGAACEDEGAEHDGREPSLGALNPAPDRSQAGWANHGEEG